MPRPPQWSLSLRLPHQDPIHPLSSPIRATCPAHLILLHFITRTILGEEYKSFSYSLCNLLHSPVTSSLLGPNILLNTMFSNRYFHFKTKNNSFIPGTEPHFLCRSAGGLVDIATTLSLLHILHTVTAQSAKLAYLSSKL